MRFPAFFRYNPFGLTTDRACQYPRIKMILYIQHHGKYIFEITELYREWLKSSHAEPTFGR